MNPIDCGRQDHRLYYHNTIMYHDQRGVVEVAVTDLQFNVRCLTRGSRWNLTTPESLTSIWPQPGAINYEHRAIYVGRRARRQAQRSCTINHYYAEWGNPDMIGSINRYMLMALVQPEYQYIEQAIAGILSSERQSTAVSRDLIVGPKLALISKGKEVGTLVEKDGEFFFQPTLARDPAAQRAAFKLAKDGILCL